MPTSSTNSAAKGSANFIPLPDNYVPHPYDVIIGRGRRANKHNENNTILQYLLNNYAAEYVDCTRDRKSELITSVAQEIKTHNGSFIKKVHKKGGWHAVDDDLIRITTAQYLRNQVPQNFKSSKQFKRKMRDEKRQEKLAATVTSSTQLSTGTGTIVAPGACPSSALVSLEDRADPCNGDMLEQKQLGELVGTVLRFRPDDDRKPQNELRQESEARPQRATSQAIQFLEKNLLSSHCFGLFLDQLDMDLSDPNPFEPLPLSSMF